jgi:hypothetical protein
MTSIRLSPAQVSAIECADLEELLVLAGSFSGAVLRFELHDAEQLAGELTEAANSEDAVAAGAGDFEPEQRQAARRACLSLSAVARKIRALGAAQARLRMTP